MGRRDALRVLGEPEEGAFASTRLLRVWCADTSSFPVHPRNEDGVRWSQEGEGQERPYHPSQGGCTLLAIHPSIDDKS